MAVQFSTSKMLLKESFVKAEKMHKVLSVNSSFLGQVINAAEIS